jgi:hypothetical protein
MEHLEITGVLNVAMECLRKHIRLFSVALKAASMSGGVEL